mgnify:CR=1 FL=1
MLSLIKMKKINLNYYLREIFVIIPKKIKNKKTIAMREKQMMFLIQIKSHRHLEAPIWHMLKK